MLACRYTAPHFLFHVATCDLNCELCSNSQDMKCEKGVRVLRCDVGHESACTPCMPNRILELFGGTNLLGATLARIGYEASPIILELRLMTLKDMSFNSRCNEMQEVAQLFFAERQADMLLNSKCNDLQGVESIYKCSSHQLQNTRPRFMRLTFQESSSDRFLLLLRMT